MYPMKTGEMEPIIRAPVHKYANVLPSLSMGAIELIRASLAGAEAHRVAPTAMETKSRLEGERSISARAAMEIAPVRTQANKINRGSYISTSFPTTNWLNPAEIRRIEKYQLAVEVEVITVPKISNV
jgi:hypothetical protein